MKKIASLFVVFLLAYLAAHFWIRSTKRVSDDVTKLGRLISCEPNDVQAVSLIHNGLGAETSIDFFREDRPAASLPSATKLSQAVWKIRRNPSPEADATLLNRLASMSCEIYDPIPVRDEDWQPLKGGSVEIKISVLENSQRREYKISFGQVSTDRMSVIRFFTSSDSAEKFKTYKMPAKLFQLASLSPETFINLKALRMSSDNVQRLEHYVQDKIKFSLEREGSDWLLSTGKERIRSLGADKFVNRLGTLKGLSLEKSEYTAKDCLRGPSAYKIKFFGIAGKEEALIFRPDPKSKNFLVCNSARDSLWRVHSDIKKYIDVKQP